MEFMIEKISLVIQGVFDVVKDGIPGGNPLLNFRVTLCE
jgi:hypothetical protein